jgi:acyl-CoA reductase-like NAD-dependent aldehyde dehydrogenase
MGDAVEKHDISDDLLAVIDRARRAQVGWSALGWRQRRTLLRKLASAVARDDELARAVTLDTGKPLFEAVGFELGYVCEVIRYFTGRAGRLTLAESKRSSLIFPHKRVRVAWRPRGVVAVIGPSNFPLLNNFGDAVAPLVAGNAVVLKPSPRTPRASRRMAELWHQAGLPADVFQVVEGESETGQALIAAVDMVFFTGSLAAGKHVARQAGERLIPCVAELGGKSAMIVLADADVPAAARAAVWGAFAGGGQVCIRVERVFVEESIADAFSHLVVEETARLRVGGAGACRAGPAEEFDVGPVLVESQIERYQAQVDDAVVRGARLLAGGRRLGGVWQPTVLDHVSPQAAVVCQETFGPLLPIVRVRDGDEAVALTNGSELGLSGAVWSGNPVRARNLARNLQTGSVCINDILVNYFCVSGPLGAARRAGLGFRHGPEALHQFCYPQTVVEDRPILRPLAVWLRRQLGFPYRGRVLGVLRWLLKAIYR